MADQVAQQVNEFARLLTVLTPLELKIPCHGEREGDTPGAVIVRAAATYDRAAVILGGVRARSGARTGVRSTAAAVVHGPTGGRRTPQALPADVEGLGKWLTASGSSVAERVRRLTDQELARPLSADMVGFDNMDKPVGMIIEYMIYCQGGHYDAISRAIAAFWRSTGRKPLPLRAVSGA